MSAGRCARNRRRNRDTVVTSDSSDVFDQYNFIICVHSICVLVAIRFPLYIKRGLPGFFLQYDLVPEVERARMPGKQAKIVQSGSCVVPKRIHFRVAKPKLRIFSVYS